MHVCCMCVSGHGPAILESMHAHTLLAPPVLAITLPTVPIHTPPSEQVAPLLRWIPPVWTSYLLYLSVLPERLFKHYSSHESLAMYPRHLAKRIEHAAHTRRVVLTGHSLGGSMAKVCMCWPATDSCMCVCGSAVSFFGL